MKTKRVWRKPQVEIVRVGTEINAYACAELN
ncbi:MAG: pyrroloquinoline quinone precursor peptide PqqA [Alphaproteobacteria bacterium]